MSKRIKLKLKLNFSAFQFCRPKNVTSSAATPSIPGTINRLSPVNTKALDINYPRLPGPPPSTPDQAAQKSNAVSPKIVCVGRRSSTYSRTTSIDLSEESHSFESMEFVNTNKDSYYKIERTAYRKDKLKENIEGSIVDEESETLISSSRSFCYDSSYDFGTQYMESETDNDFDYQSPRQKKVSQLMPKRLMVSPAEKGPSGEMAVEGRTKESVAVVKKSEDPYGDFKKSMMEMIVEKQILEAKGLEELLQCFLSLNSRQYHGIIVQAFSEIWETLFCNDDTSVHQL